MVCTTPMFAAVKKYYPKAEVWVVGDEVNKQLLEGHPYVDGYIVWRRGTPLLTKELRAHGFDFLCITAPSAEAVASAYLAGVPCIVSPVIAGGWSPYETRSYKLLRSLVLTRLHTMGQYAPREYLRLLEPIGIYAEDTTKAITYSPEAADMARSFFAEIKKGASMVVGVAPAAGNKIKQWPPERFAAVANYVVEKHNAAVIVFGGPRDTEEVHAMMRSTTHPERIRVIPPLSIEEFKAFVAQTNLFVSADTGPIYLAEAFAIPTIDIVGPVDEREQPPQGGRHIVIVPQREKPQLYVMNARVHDKAEVERQSLATSVAEVCRAVDTFFSYTGK